jgi:hypothetical protein
VTDRHCWKPVIGNQCDVRLMLFAGRITRFWEWVLLCAASVAAFTEIAGDLPSVVAAGKSPYLVVADLFVPAGKSVRIEPGTVFLFNNFTGLHVHGILSARGNVLQPIIFTSSNDHLYNGVDTLNPTPYDWNGIYIQKDGMGTVLEHFKVCYSVKGIVSETKFISLNAGIFNENGRSHCIIEGVEQNVTPGAPFSHAVAVKDATIDGVPVNILRDPLAPKRNIIRYSGLTFMVVGVALSSISGLRLRDSQAEFEALSSPDTSNTLRENGDVLWEEAHARRDRDRVGLVAGTLLTLLGGIGLWWTFTF